MRTFLLAAALSLSASAGAQIQNQLPFSLNFLLLKSVFPAGYDVAEACKTLKIDAYGDATYTLPARFPNPAREDHTPDDYSLTCPNLIIEHRKYTAMRLQVDSFANLYSLLEMDYYNVPYLFDITGNQYLDISTPGVVKVAKGENPDAPHSDVVIGLKQGNAPIIPIVFGGKTQEAAYDPAAPADLYIRNTREWQKITLDASHGIIYFTAKAPFPPS